MEVLNSECRISVSTSTTIIKQMGCVVIAALYFSDNQNPYHGVGHNNSAFRITHSELRILNYPIYPPLRRHQYRKHGEVVYRELQKIAPLPRFSGGAVQLE